MSTDAGPGDATQLRFTLPAREFAQGGRSRKKGAAKGGGKFVWVEGIENSQTVCGGSLEAFGSPRGHHSRNGPRYGCTVPDFGVVETEGNFGTKAGRVLPPAFPRIIT